MRLLAVVIFTGTILPAQQTVCDLFKDLKVADGREVVLRDTLIISRDFAALSADECAAEYRTGANGSDKGPFLIWPVALRLRPSSVVSPNQLRQFRDAAAKADLLRGDGKAISASAIFSGRVHLGVGGDLPGELIFDSFEDIAVEPLPEASELPVIPICELFQNLPAWKGKRIAVRGEVSSTFEGGWLVGNCKGNFITDGFLWPVSLTFALPAGYSRSTEKFTRPRASPQPKGATEFRGRHSTQTATYVGRLQMRNEYHAVCRSDGSYMGTVLAT